MKRRIMISLGVLVILVAAFIILKQNGTVEKTLPVFGIDSTAIGKIRVISPMDTIQIEQTDKGWWLSEPVKWEADSTQVSHFFMDVMHAQYAKTAMTSSKDAVTRYGLDGTKGLQVLVWDKKGKLSKHAYFSNNGNVYDYLRFEGSTEIYQMNRLISITYGNGVIDWRSTVITRAPESELNSISVKYPNGSYTLTHKGNDWVYRDSKEEFTVPFDNRAIIRLLNILVNLDTQLFIDDNTEQYLPAFEKPLATAVLSFKTGKVTKLTFAGTENKEFFLMLDDKPKPLYGVANDTILRFTVNGDKFSQIPYGATPPERKKL